MSLLSDDDKALLVLEHLGPAALAGDTMSLYDCFQLALDVAEKAVLAKLAAKELPEPAGTVDYYSANGVEWRELPANETEIFTATQLHEAHAQGFAAGAASQLAEKPSGYLWAPKKKPELAKLAFQAEPSVQLKALGYVSEPLYTRREAK